MRAIQERDRVTTLATQAPARRASVQRKTGEHRKSAEVRERILNATLEVARDSGYQGLTIARVSAASNMPSGSVYWHFENKDGLLRAALDLSFQRQLIELEKFAPLPGEAPHPYVTRIFEMLRIDEQPWGFWRIGATLVADETAPEQQTLERFREVREETRALYTGWWSEVLPEDESTPQFHRPEDFADLTLVIYDGFNLALAASDTSARQAHVLAAAMHGMVDAVMMARAAGSSA